MHPFFRLLFALIAFGGLSYILMLWAPIWAPKMRAFRVRRAKQKERDSHKGVPLLLAELVRRVNVTQMKDPEKNPGIPILLYLDSGPVFGLLTGKGKLFARLSEMAPVFQVDDSELTHVKEIWDLTETLPDLTQPKELLLTNVSCYGVEGDVPYMVIRLDRVCAFCLADGPSVVRWRNSKKPLTFTEEGEKKFERTYSC